MVACFRPYSARQSLQKKAVMYHADLSIYLERDDRKSYQGGGGFPRKHRILSHQLHTRNGRFNDLQLDP